MDTIDFNIGMKKLKANWPNSFADEKIAYIFEKLRFLSAHDFEKVIDKILCYSKHAPSIAEILENANAFRNQRFENSIEIRGSCGKCQDGVLTANDTESLGAPYAFRCNCDLGLRKKENWPVCGPNFERRFKLVLDSDYGPKKEVEPKPSISNIVDLSMRRKNNNLDGAS